DLAVPGLEAEVLVDHEPDARGPAQVHHPPRLVERGRERLLADDVYATLGRGLADLGVGRWWRDDVDEVGALGRDRLEGGGIPPRDTKLRSCRDGTRGVAVAHGDDLDLGDAGPGVVVELAEVAGADADAPELRRHSTPSGRSARMRRQASRAITLSPAPT